MSGDPFKLVGTVIDGKYRVDELIGEGGFGLVYRGFHLNFEQPIAIKCLKVPAHFTRDARALFLDKFREEGKHLAKLRHQAIVRVFDFGLASGSQVPYLVLEWLTGEDLEQHLARRGRPYSEQEAIQLLRPAVDALSLAHRRGIAHRDIKPANIFLAETEDGTALRVLDFGIAKAMQEGDTATRLTTKTSSGFSAFSPSYGAPEQFRSTKFGPTGPWTDVHALGLVLVELLAGRPAFEGQEHADFYEQCMRSHRPTPRHFGVQTSDAMERLCARALALEPKNRFPSAGEMLSAVESVLAAGEPLQADRGVQVGQVAPTVPAVPILPAQDAELLPDRAGVGRTPAAYLAFGGGLAAVALLVLVAWLSVSSSAESSPPLVGSNDPVTSSADAGPTTTSQPPGGTETTTPESDSGTGKTSAALEKLTGLAGLGWGDSVRVADSRYSHIQIARTAPCKQGFLDTRAIELRDVPLPGAAAILFFHRDNGLFELDIMANASRQQVESWVSTTFHGGSEAAVTVQRQNGRAILRVYHVDFQRKYERDAEASCHQGLR